MSRFKEWIGRALCRHDWRVSKFQALTGGTSYHCAKCGSYLHLPTDTKEPGNG